MVFIHFKGWSRKYDAWYDAKNIALKSDEEKLKYYKLKVMNKQQESLAAKKEARKMARDAKKAAEAESGAVEEESKRGNGAYKRRGASMEGENE